jgi:hypothetical protein
MPEIITIKIDDPNAGRGQGGQAGQARPQSPAQATPMTGPTFTPMTAPVMPRTGMSAPTSGGRGDSGQLNQLVNMFGTPDMKAKFGQAEQLSKMFGPQTKPMLGPTMSQATAPSAVPMAGPGAMNGAGQIMAGEGAVAGSGAAGAAGGGAAGASAGAAGAAAAAGPAAAIVMAVQNAKEGFTKAADKPNDITNVVSGTMQAGMGPILGPIIGKTMDKITGIVGDAVRGVGNIAAGSAEVTGTAMHGDNREAVMKTAEGMSKLASNVPLVGHQFELITGTSLKVVRAFTDVTDAVVARGEQLEKWSGTVAVARSVADIRALKGEFREADELGPGMARVTDAQSRLADDLREMLLPIKKFLVENLASIMERIAAWADRVKLDEWGTRIIVTLEQVVKAITEVSAMEFGAARKILGDIDKKIKDELDRRKANENDKMPLDQFLNMLDRINPIQAVAPNIGLDPRVIEPIIGRGDPRMLNPEFVGGM